MAGVKQFERSEVLDRAMALFWRRGYEATSIRDLVEATGINRGSIYGTFGDKKGLFLAVLAHYAEEVAKPMMAELSDPDPRRALDRMFDSIIRRTSDPRFPRGCLNTNTSLECPASGDEITRKIAEGFGRQESAIYRVLRRAQVRGRLDSSLDCKSIGAFLHGSGPRIERGEQSFTRPGYLDRRVPRCDDCI
jgi:TetR/AcrR family transcriptional regulator, transcriptional repressor for nem operon